MSEEVPEEEVEEVTEDSNIEEEGETESVELGITPEDMKIMVDIVEKIDEASKGELPPKELEKIYEHQKNKKKEEDEKRQAKLHKAKEKKKSKKKSK